MDPSFCISRVPSQGGPLALQSLCERRNDPLPCHPDRIEVTLSAMPVRRPKDARLDLFPDFPPKELDPAYPALSPCTQHFFHLGPRPGVHHGIGREKGRGDEPGKDVCGVRRADVLGDRIQEVE